MKVKGYKPTKKCVAYIKKMISTNSWKINEKIPSITELSNCLNVSNPTVRKAIRFFEYQGIIENYGSIGFYLKNKPEINKTLSLLRAAKTNMNIADWCHNKNSIQIKNWLVDYNNKTDNLAAINIISGIILKSKLNIIKNIIYKPVLLSNIVNIKNDTEFKKKKVLYNKQQKLMPLAKLIVKYEKEIVQNGNHLY